MCISAPARIKTRKVFVEADGNPRLILSNSKDFFLYNGQVTVFVPVVVYFSGVHDFSDCGIPEICTPGVRLSCEMLTFSDIL